MTPTSDAAFAELAEAILDGRPIDWGAAESTAAGADRPLFERLRLLAAVAAVHRSGTGSAAPAAEEPTGGDADPVIASGRWGHLRVLELIGRGANGSVYRAWDEKLDREVALKLLPPQLPRRSHRADPAIDEGRALARVRHPNVVTIYGADEVDGRVGLWMERVVGRTLEEIVRSGKRFTAREVAAIGVGLARAVAAVHAAGFVHRDIKASNAMLGGADRPVLMDFGTGCRIEDDGATLAGTPLYVAPELFQGGDPSPRSDIYSLGVVLHHLLTSSYPVQGVDLDELRRSHASGRRASVRSTRPDVPAKLADVLARALDPDPERRQQSAETLAAELEAFARPRRTRALRATVSITALVIGVGALWQLSSASKVGRSPGRPGDRPAGAAVAERRSAPLSIAVLPFEGHGAGSDGQHFADGLAEEILRDLARVEGLAVRSRYSSFSFREQPRDLRLIGERLRAVLAVTGSVMRSDDRLRVHAQLVDLAADRTLWADRYDRRLASSLDIFEITDEIARAIVNELRLTLGTGRRRYDLDVETYELYLRARALAELRSLDSAPRAVEMLERILATDPSFAPAHAGLADAYFSWSMGAAASGALRPDLALTRMRVAAERALELDPLLAEAHAAMGGVYARELQWEASERSFRRALELDPTRTSTYVRFSISTLRPLGRNDEAERLLEIAREHDPLAREVEEEIGRLQFCAGRYEDAIATLGRIETDGEVYSLARIYLGRALTFAGRIDEALAVFEEMPDPKEALPAWYAAALVRAGRRAEAEALAVAHRGSAHRELFIHAALGDRDRAFAALERHVSEEPQRVPLILTYPELALLRDDPRVTALRQRSRLP